MSTCRDGARKRAWYAAEQSLRNQTDRTYEARMDWSLDELQRGGRSVRDSGSDQNNIGVASPPDTDARGYLVAQMRMARR